MRHTTEHPFPGTAATLMALVVLLPLVGQQPPAVESAGVVTPTSGALQSGLNTIVWQQGAGAEPPARVVAALAPLLNELAVDALWMLSDGRWSFYLPSAEYASTITSVPPTAALIVFLGAELRPNLKIRPPSDLRLETAFQGRAMLRFTTISWNAGQGPLEVVGKAATADGRQAIDQRVFRPDRSFYDQPAGVFVHHPEHGHIHMDDFALYRLRRTGAADEVGRSLKLSSCLADFGREPVSLPRMPAEAVYTDCEHQRQGISVGWFDIYPSDLPGQAIDVTGLPDGTYELVVTVDPGHHLLETDETDNEASVTVELSLATGTLRVLR